MEAPHASGALFWDRICADFTAWRADGDQAAFDDLVRTLTPVLWQVVRAHDLSRATSEDVIQETWLALTRSGDRIGDPRAVGGWLLTTARRAAWKARSTRLVPTEELADDWFGTEESAEDTAIESDDNARLWRAFRTLTERCRRLLRIVAFDDRPDYQRTATELGMAVGSIGPTRKRCLDKLRTALDGRTAHDIA